MTAVPKSKDATPPTNAQKGPADTRPKTCPIDPHPFIETRDPPVCRADSAFEAEAVNISFVKAKLTQTRVVESRIGPSTMTRPRASPKASATFRSCPHNL